MPHEPFSPVLRHLRKLVSGRPLHDLPDAELVERFATQHEEPAFETLLERHGPLVLGVCRRLLSHPHDVEDAFQATFVVLARKASSIAKRELVGPWLYGVAYRISLKGRATAAERRAWEKQVADMSLAESHPESTWNDLRPVLDEEVQRLPAKYRLPIVLCYLEGKTNEQAAQELHWPAGTVKTRLTRGREMLRSRLTRRGLALSAASLAVLLADGAARASVPAELLATTYHAALGDAVAVLSPAVAALAQAGVESTILTRLRSGIFALAAVLAFGSAGGLIYTRLAGTGPADAIPGPDRAIALPADPKAVVLSWDCQREGLKRHDAEPQLVIHADGSLTVRAPYGPGKTLDGNLTGAELQELLRFAIDGQDYFHLDERAVQDQVASAPGPGTVTTRLHVRADGQDHAVQCADLARLAATSAGARRLRAIEQRLERLTTWVYAGEQAGVATALALANERLHRQFPSAPALTADDLQSAWQHADDHAAATFQRRGVNAGRDPFSFVYAHLERSPDGETQVVVKADLADSASTAAAPGKPNTERLNIAPKPIGQDASVVYDFDIVYVRAPRHGDDRQIHWTEVFSPLRGEPGSDLMLLHPDGREDVLVVAGDDAITDPAISFDGEWVYFARFHNVKQAGTQALVSRSADIFKIHVKSRQVVPLTRQVFTPNTGVAATNRPVPGVYNLAPCPLPGGKVMFTSNRNGFAPTKGYTPTTLQLFVMDDDGANVECVGHLNVNSALHPTVLKDGRVMFTSYESQGLRDLRLWALWTIHPDGTQWAPLFSAFGPSGDTAYHFMTQLADGHVVVEEYYNLNNLGFGTYFKLAPDAPAGQPYFGSASRQDPRNAAYNGSGLERIPFSPHGLEWLTTFCTAFDAPARLSDPQDPDSPRVGKVTHPSAAPDNHLLTVWSPGPVNSNNGLRKPAIDAGLYLIKSGRSINEPGQMLLIKNDPKYNEQWPRALVPYRRIYGIDEPRRLPTVRNDGKQSPHLPEGTPYGLIGSSSLYKHESYPGGTVPPGQVRARFAGGNDPFQGLGTLAYSGIGGNWFVQGADAGRYANSDIHAVRILITEPTTDPRHTRAGQRRWWNAANERLRILGEIPVRKFSRDAKGTAQPLDPDGNPDTSFLVKIPADTPFTFQTLDRFGRVLNMAQTWHQVRPGEIRHDCGGCHAHSQQPTPFERTAAARKDYQPFDLTQQTPLLTAKQNDQSGRQWDEANETGLRYEKAVKNVEYHRDVRPIFERSCVACHTRKWDQPASSLVLDDDQPMAGPGSLGGLVNGPAGQVPGTYFRLALDHAGRFGRKSPVGNWAHPQASRYVRLFQSRRSLLAWKIYGQRLDGFRNEDFAHERVPGDASSLVYQGKPFANTPQNQQLINLAYTDAAMPPPDAVSGTYVGPGGQKIRVAPLSDEDRRTIVRWIDLGCPIDLDFDPARPQAVGAGWLQDDGRPTLTLTEPQPGANERLTRLLVGMHDYGSGLDPASLEVTADFAIDGIAAGRNLAERFQPKTPGVWEMRLAQPPERLRHGKLTVAVKDRQGNLARIERSFSVAPAGNGR